MRTENIKLLLVVLGAVIIGYMIYSYNKTSTESFANLPDNNLDEALVGGYPETVAPADAHGHHTLERGPSMNDNVLEPSGALHNAPQASEPHNDNEVFTSVANFNPNQDGPTGLSNNQYPKDAYPKDQLSPAELLPGDANSTWAQVNPSGQGSLGDQNFLNAGFHVGTNTVGQTLRNANLQLRSEPPNPQVKVSPWLQSTIEPDTNRKALEIGGQ